MIHAGSPDHPKHERFILELGRATYAAGQLAGIAFDILRIFDGVPSAEMYNDPLGRLISRLERLLAREPAMTGLGRFIELISEARVVRNDLLHALPVANGLHRRTATDLHRVVNFYTVEDLAVATAQLREAHREGSRLLYHDGGAAVQAWYAGTNH